MDHDNKARAETRQMLALVGEAISEWSFVELSLCNLFTICLTPTSTNPNTDYQPVEYTDFQVPTAIFYSVENFRGKLGMLDAALCARVPDSGQQAVDIRNEWSKLREKIRKLSLKRNKLAHWTVTPAYYDTGISNPSRLMPPYGSPGWWSETSSRPAGNYLDPKQVDEIVRAFSLINEKIRDFYMKLAGNPALTDKFDELTVRLIRSHDRRCPTRAERIRRDLSSPE